MTAFLPVDGPEPEHCANPSGATPHQLAGRLVLAWLAVRTIGWTLLMTARPNPPLDVIEWLSWGRHWQLGYHKHPPLAAWVAEVGWAGTPGSFFGIYLLGYLAVALALWSVWNLARQVLPLRAALAATLCLEGLVYVGLIAGEFNNQVLLVGFWAMLIDRAYAAWEHDRPRDWLLAGLALGLALLCKYSVAFLVVPLLGWWFGREGTRRPLTAAGFVAGVAGLIFLPHLLWLWRNDFVTLKYASRRVQGEADDAGVPRVATVARAVAGRVRLAAGVARPPPVVGGGGGEDTPPPAPSPAGRGGAGVRVRGRTGSPPFVCSPSPQAGRGGPLPDRLTRAGL